jgi:hypothetical protein
MCPRRCAWLARTLARRGVQGGPQGAAGLPHACACLTRTGRDAVCGVRQVGRGYHLEDRHLDHDPCHRCALHHHQSILPRAHARPTMPPSQGRRRLPVAGARNTATNVTLDMCATRAPRLHHTRKTRHHVIASTRHFIQHTESSRVLSAMTQTIGWIRRLSSTQSRSREVDVIDHADQDKARGRQERMRRGAGGVK